MSTLRAKPKSKILRARDRMRVAIRRNYAFPCGINITNVLPRRARNGIEVLQAYPTPRIALMMRSKIKTPPIAMLMMTKAVD